MGERCNAYHHLCGPLPHSLYFLIIFMRLARVLCAVVWQVIRGLSGRAHQARPFDDETRWLYDCWLRYANEHKQERKKKLSLPLNIVTRIPWTQLKLVFYFKTTSLRRHPTRAGCASVAVSNRFIIFSPFNCVLLLLLLLVHHRQVNTIAWRRR